MKKIFLALAALFCVATVSAQGGFESSVKSAAHTVASQKWSVGGRVGSGLQAQVECFYSGNAYLEARLGMNWAGHNAYIGADFTFLHNWNVCTMDWTPSAGQWFFDAGVGVNVGGGKNLVTFGIAGQAKLGIKFSGAPVRLAIDVTPSFGPGFRYNNPAGNGPFFHRWGICNVGASATYCF